MCTLAFPQRSGTTVREIHRETTLTRLPGGSSWKHGGKTSFKEGHWINGVTILISPCMVAVTSVLIIIKKTFHFFSSRQTLGFEGNMTKRIC